MAVEYMVHNLRFAFSLSLGMVEQIWNDVLRGGANEASWCAADRLAVQFADVRG